MVQELEPAFHNSIKYDDKFICQGDGHFTNSDGTVILQQDDREQNLPTFGNISVTSSSDVHFGNKNIYQGPVTIQQFVYPKEEKALGNVNNNDKEDVPQCDNKNNQLFYESSYDNHACDEKSTVKTSEQKVNLGSLEYQSENVDAHGGNYFKHLLLHYRIAASSLSVFIIALCLFGFLLTYLLKNGTGSEISKTSLPSFKEEEQDHNTPIEAPLDPNTDVNLPSKLKMVTRLEWLAQPPSKPTDSLNTPVPYVILSHTATENCSSQAQCVFQVRYIQTFHMESRGWHDIGYNFLLGGDGEVYVGRGWDKEGAHTYGYNKKSIGISFIGTFISTLPPQYELDSCKKLIETGVQLGYIKENYKILTPRQLQTTQSPGKALYEEIKTWDHWAAKP